MRHMTKCGKCNIYTMKEKCPKCNIDASNPKPLKYSPDDKYASYRRKAKLEQWRKSGLI